MSFQPFSRHAPVQRLLMVGLWLAFSVSLVVWQHIFTLHLFDLLVTTNAHPQAERWVRMVKLETLTLIVALSGGGFSLLLSLRREHSRQKLVRDFFTTFTHELKTSLASLQLRAEKAALAQASIASSTSTSILASEGFLKDLQRLQLQLENSLFLAQPNEALYVETLQLSDLIAAVRGFADIQIHLPRDGEVIGDRRAFESILKNAIANAVHHGKADQIWVEALPSKDRTIKMQIRDNGIGFPGNYAKLGMAFHRPQSNSGSGLGLYILKKLGDSMKGHVWFGKGVDASNTAQGFAVFVSVPGRWL